MDQSSNTTTRGLTVKSGHKLLKASAAESVEGCWPELFSFGVQCSACSADLLRLD